MTAEESFWVAAIKPFFVLVILAVFGIPITWAVKRWMKDGPRKRLLLDRDLTNRKPWIGVVAAIAAWLAIPLCGWLGIVISGWLR